MLGYGVAGIIAFLIMRQLGEMVVEEPVSGSFAHFAYKYWGPFAGGWNYWVMFVLVGMAELTAAGICSTGSRRAHVGLGCGFLYYHQRRQPGERALVWRSRVLVALIKVLAIIGMIGFGLWMLFSGHGGESRYR